MPTPEPGRLLTDPYQPLVRFLRLFSNLLPLPFRLVEAPLPRRFGSREAGLHFLAEIPYILAYFLAEVPYILAVLPPVSARPADQPSHGRNEYGVAQIEVADQKLHHAPLLTAPAHGPLIPSEW